jgi:hypothetical protein
MATIVTGLTITASYGSKYFSELPLAATQASVDQFCIEKGYTSGQTFTTDGGRWSNDGARLMNEYKLWPNKNTTGSTYAWNNTYNYGGIVTSITQ